MPALQVAPPRLLELLTLFPLHISLSMHDADSQASIASVRACGSRLHRLLELYGGFAVAEYSSQLSQDARSKILQEFRAGAIQV